MTDSDIVQLNTPAEDALNEVLKRDAQMLLAQALETELEQLLCKHAGLQVEGKRAVVRNGHLPSAGFKRALVTSTSKSPRSETAQVRGFN